MTQAEQSMEGRRETLLQPGDTLAQGAFSIDRFLANGKYAEVYHARDRDLETHAGGAASCAIKILQRAHWHDADARARLAREAMLQASAVLGRHQNVVEVRARGQHTMADPTGSKIDVPFFVMAYIEHITLLDYLNRFEAGLPQDGRLARIVTQLGHALDWIHSRQQPVVHRDLAAHNIMLRCERREGVPLLLSERQDFVQLTDFGLAYVAGDPRITQVGLGQIRANICYASPEILEDRVPDPRDDGYAFAALAYQMLTGRLPFACQGVRYWGAGDYQDFVAMVATRPVMFREADGIPDRVQDVVLRGLAKRRAERYPSAGAFADDLVAALGLGEKSTAGPAPIRPGTGRAGTDFPNIGYETAEARAPTVIASEAQATAEPQAAPPPSPRRPSSPPPHPLRRRLARFGLAAAAILATSALSVYGLAWGGERVLNRPPAGPGSTPATADARAAASGGAVAGADRSPTVALADWGELAYVTGEADAQRLIVEGSDGARVELPGVPPREVTDLAWSPDGTRLAYVLQAEDAIYLHDGRAAERLSEPGKRERWPTWSPDGAQLAVEAEDATGTAQIVVHTLNTGARRRATEGALGSWAPAWSPRGDALAFIAETQGGTDVYLLRLDDLSTPPVKISRAGNVAIDRPAWSPDGTWLVYATEDGLRWVSVENSAHPGAPQPLTASAWDRGPCVDGVDGSVLFHRQDGEGGPDLLRVNWREGVETLVRRDACCVALNPRSR